MQGWPDELPLLINGTVDTGNNATTRYDWQLDLPVVLFSFGYCIVCLLILVQVGQTRPFNNRDDAFTSIENLSISMNVDGLVECVIIWNVRLDL